MKKNKFIVFISIFIVLLFTLILNIGIHQKTIISSEMKKLQTYNQISDEDYNIDNCDFVKFNAYFARDINNDKIAEKLDGTCNKITNGSDFLYLDLLVNEEGYLENGKIEINGENFKYSLNVVKDNILKYSYNSNDVDSIEFNTINAGSQKLIIGNIRSFINKSNINNYSRVSTIVLTGTYVSSTGERTDIRKSVPIKVDWYGEMDATISGNGNKYYLDEFVDKYNTVSFNVTLNETLNQLIVKSNKINIKIPDLNGYKANKVYCNNSNVYSNYDEETGIFSLKREANCDNNGYISNISRYNTYTVNVEYPSEAFGTLENYYSMKFETEGYIEGYNNPNEEFQNPYITDTKETNIYIDFERSRPSSGSNSAPIPTNYYDNFYLGIRIGFDKSISKKYIIEAYDELGKDEIENIEYIVNWTAVTGKKDMEYILMKEYYSQGDRFDNYQFVDFCVTYKGIAFDSSTDLKRFGDVYIYDAETNELIKEFKNSELGNYTKTNPYIYETPIKHIKIKTSMSEENSFFGIKNIKELDLKKFMQKY